jgi:hypothetical protein
MELATRSRHIRTQTRNKSENDDDLDGAEDTGSFGLDDDHDRPWTKERHDSGD